MSKSILVTGGTGLLGAHLLYQLTTAGNRVKATYRTGSKRSLTEKIFSYYTNDPYLLLDKIEWIAADLLDMPAVSEAMKNVNHVYHCAALVSFAGDSARNLMEVNPQTTANVVNAAIDEKIEKLVYVSSVAALGRAKQGKMISEKTSWQESKNNSVYAKSKYQAEIEVWRGAEEGLNVAIVNPGIILGPGTWSEGSGTFFNTIGKGFKFYTAGINGFVDVRDVASAMQRLMDSDISHERFVLISENRSYQSIFGKIAEELNVKPPSVEAKRWMGELVWRLEKIKSFFGGSPAVTRETARTARQKNLYDNTKIKKALNFEFRPVDESIADFAKFYHRDHS